jgi:hypothetical protein
MFPSVPWSARLNRIIPTPPRELLELPQKWRDRMPKRHSPYCPKKSPYSQPPVWLDRTRRPVGEYSAAEIFLARCASPPFHQSTYKYPPLASIGF